MNRLNTAQVRDWAEKHLRRDVPDQIWQYVVDDRWVQEVIDGEDDARPRLLKQIRRLEVLVAANEKNRGRLRRFRDKPPTGLKANPAEERRALILSRHLARVASRTRRVTFLRDRLGLPLANLPDEPHEKTSAVWTAINTPAPKSLTADQLIEAGIPALGGMLRMTRQTLRDGRLVREFRADPPGVSFTVVGPADDTNPNRLRMPGPEELDEEEQAIPVWPGSVLDEIRGGFMAELRRRLE